MDMSMITLKPSQTQNEELITNMRQIRYTRWQQNDALCKVNSLDWLPNGERLLAASDDRTIKVFDLNGDEVTVIPSKKYGCDLIRFMADGNTAVLASNYEQSAVGANHHKIRHLDLVNKNFIHYYAGHEQPVTNIAVNHRLNCFMSSSEDNTIRLWDCRLRGDGLLAGDRQSLAVLRGVKPIVSFDPEGVVFAVGVQSNSMRLYDMRNFGRGPFTVNRYESESANQWKQLKFSPNGKLIAVSTNGSKMPIIDAYSLAHQTSLVGMKNEMSVNLELSWSTDSRFLFCGSSSSFPRAGDAANLNMFRADGRGLVKSWKTCHESAMRNVKFNPKYYLIATACIDVSYWAVTVEDIKRLVSEDDMM